MQTINYRFLDAMYVYVSTIGHVENFVSNHNPNLIGGRYRREQIKTVQQLEYIKLCFDLFPELLNCCWLDEAPANAILSLVVKQSLVNYEQSLCETCPFDAYYSFSTEAPLPAGQTIRKWPPIPTRSLAARRSASRSGSKAQSKKTALKPAKQTPVRQCHLGNANPYNT